MIFNKHLELNGTHACFSPSQSAWLRYTDDKIVKKVNSMDEAFLGTELHEFAASQISLQLKYSTLKDLSHSILSYIYRKYYDEERAEITETGNKILQTARVLPKEKLVTLQQYINDGSGFRMKTEQTLVYSDFIYGTADAIRYEDDVLRISDYKSGKHPVSMDQLLVYAALFCLEYKVDPMKTKFHLRIYQQGKIICNEPEGSQILDIANRIVYVNKVATSVRGEL